MTKQNVLDGLLGSFIVGAGYFLAMILFSSLKVPSFSLIIALAIGFGFGIAASRRRNR